ncbi:hypothetical protein [Alsobacter sp. R-9]
MSRGPGRVQRAILALFSETPKAILSTAELCAAVYGTTPDKRHRVAVLRALRACEGLDLRHAGHRHVRFVPGRVHERADDLWYNAEIWTPRYGEVLRVRRRQARRMEAGT